MLTDPREAPPSTYLLLAGLVLLAVGAVLPW